MNIWQTLGLAPTKDKAAIRSAYARKTRECHPEEDPAGFAALHEAYDAAMRFARGAPPARARVVPRPVRRPAPEGENAPGTSGAAAGGTPCALPSADFSPPAAPDGTPPPSGENYDFDSLFARAQAARRKALGRTCAAVLARFERLAAERAPAALWDDALEDADFLEIYRTPEFAGLLAAFLSGRSGLPDAFLDGLVGLYPMARLEQALRTQDGPPGLAALYRALQPAQAALQARLARQDEAKRQKKRRRAWAVLALLSAGCAAAAVFSSDFRAISLMLLFYLVAGAAVYGLVRLARRGKLRLFFSLLAAPLVLCAAGGMLFPQQRDALRLTGGLLGAIYGTAAISWLAVRGKKGFGIGDRLSARLGGAHPLTRAWRALAGWLARPRGAEWFACRLLQALVIGMLWVAAASPLAALPALGCFVLAWALRRPWFSRLNLGRRLAVAAGIWMRLPLAPMLFLADSAHLASDAYFLGLLLCPVLLALWATLHALAPRRL